MLISRAFSFARISQSIPLRKEILKVSEKANKKIAFRGIFYSELSLFGKASHLLWTHKKKNIFFVFLLSIDYYFDFHTRVYKWATRETPMERIRKILLKKKIYKWHVSCVEPEASLPKDLQQKMIDHFITKESELLRGYPRYPLIEIAFEEKWLDEKDKWIGTFYHNSGFRRFKSQKNSNMTLKEFLSFFEHVKEKNPDISLEDTFRIYQEKAEERIKAARQRGDNWLKKLDKRKQEDIEKLKGSLGVKAQ